ILAILGASAADGKVRDNALAARADAGIQGARRAQAPVAGRLAEIAMFVEGFQEAILLQIVEVIIGEAVFRFKELVRRRVGVGVRRSTRSWSRARPRSWSGTRLRLRLSRLRQFLLLHTHQANEDFARLRLFLLVDAAIDDRQTPTLGIQAEKVLEMVDAAEALAGEGNQLIVHVHAAAHGIGRDDLL